jgi:aerobic-type carbon monoxide dehydrogenase small subunit (CoxS/CutS family)
MQRDIRFRLNGRPAALTTDDQRNLLWVLRGDENLTGTKYGCGLGICGACTVVVDGQAVRSCQTTLADVQGKNVVTIEGLERDGKLHPLQQAFVDHGGFQCGYCTSGMIMNAYAMLQKTPHPSRDQILQEMDGNLCRCGAHQRIVAAIQEASK